MNTNPVIVLDSFLVDSVVSDFPVGFRFLSSGTWQFIGYYGKDRSLRVASRKKGTRNWQYKTLSTKVGWDSHNRISMAVDRDSCIHLSGNMHNDTLIYFKTEEANNISTFKRVFPLVLAADEYRCTYPSFMKNMNEELIFSYRKGGSGNGITVSNIYDERIKSFKRLTDQPLFDGLGLMSAYARGPILGPDHQFHVIWLWRDTPGAETNHDLSYARSQDLVHWLSSEGTMLRLPITPNSTQCTVDPIPPGGGAINGGATLFFGTDDSPLIAYMKYDYQGASQIYLARKEGEGWISKQVSDWSYRWDFSGPGSITFDIRLGKCYVNEEKIFISYKHILKGSGELIIDARNMERLEDRKKRNPEALLYPLSLINPSSGIDSVDVHWLSDGSGTNQSATFYALRWETMGKRRFYKAPDDPVKPSALKLYEFSRKR